MSKPKDVSYLVSAEIRAHLARKRLRQGPLCEVLGISQPQVSARLRGAVPWTVDELVAVADFLDVPPADLIKVAA